MELKYELIFSVLVSETCLCAGYFFYWIQQTTEFEQTKINLNESWGDKVLCQF